MTIASAEQRATACRWTSIRASDRAAGISSAIAWTSLGATRRPPCGDTISGIPPQAKATTGVPHDIASATTSPYGSCQAGVTSAAAERPTKRASSSWSRCPAHWTWSSSDGAMARLKYAVSLMGPARTSGSSARRAAAIAMCGAFSAVMRPNHTRLLPPGPSGHRRKSTPLGAYLDLYRAVCTSRRRQVGDRAARPPTPPLMENRCVTHDVVPMFNRGIRHGMELMKSMCAPMSNWLDAFEQRPNRISKEHGPVEIWTLFAPSPRASQHQGYR